MNQDIVNADKPVVIEVKNLIKTYGERYAINKINFKINQGDVVGLLGPNGAGKSTTMKIITGFMSPTSGSVKVCGFDVFENPIEVKKRIGYLPENPPLYLDMTVYDYLKYVTELKLVPKSEQVKNIDSALKKTQLTEVRHRIIKNLSKGFKQRVGIAQALVSNPEILILDEPTVGLDPKQVTEIRELINELKGQHTIILSTHILSEVEASCNKIIILHQGQLILDDNIENIHAIRQQQTQINLKLRTDVDINFKLITGVVRQQKITAKSYLLHIENDELTIQSILQALIAKKIGLTEFTIKENNLEDIFIKLTYDKDKTV
jgi:ABC-2 type transport system ATP-binding protein